MRTDLPTAYDRADLKQLLRKTIWQGRPALRTLVTLVPLAILAVIVGGWSSDPALELVGYILGGGLLGWLVLIAPATGSRFALRKLHRGGQTLEQTFELADDAFVTRNSNGESRHNWSSIISVETEMERLFVFVTDRCAFIVPRRAFNDKTRFDSFSAEASARWKAARQ